MSRGNPKPSAPPSRGIPSDESMWMPRHYGGEVKSKGGLDKTVFWSVEEVVDFVFPKKYQPKYHQVASHFIRLVLNRDWVTKKEISRFLEENDYSKSTLENKIIPKLVRFGFIKRQREIKGRLGKGRGLILSESLTFTNYVERIGFAWNMLVSTARQKDRKKKVEKKIEDY